MRTNDEMVKLGLQQMALYLYSLSRSVGQDISQDDRYMIATKLLGCAANLDEMTRLLYPQGFKDGDQDIPF